MERMMVRAALITGNQGLVKPTQAQVDMINARIRPPQPVTAESIYVRRARVINTMVDHYHTRFMESAVPQVAAMLPTRPMLVNHTRGSGIMGMPVARWFDAAALQNPDGDGVDWVQGDFYWPRGVEQADYMAAMMDTGVWSEVSLAWWFTGCRCSICGRDPEDCTHIPGEDYGEKAGVCHWDMYDITRVDEASVVWAGGQKDTEIQMAAALSNPSSVVSMMRGRRSQDGWQKLFPGWRAEPAQDQQQEQPTPAEGCQTLADWFTAAAESMKGWADWFTGQAGGPPDEDEEEADEDEDEDEEPEEQQQESLDAWFTGNKPDGGHPISA
jgi:hypothetical protein